ncbi:hypothetical protein CC79DRAFT_1222271 [Sarocladium strictum]
MVLRILAQRSTTTCLRKISIIVFMTLLFERWGPLALQPPSPYTRQAILTGIWTPLRTDTVAICTDNVPFRFFCLAT